MLKLHYLIELAGILSLSLLKGFSLFIASLTILGVKSRPANVYCLTAVGYAFIPTIFGELRCGSAFKSLT